MDKKISNFHFIMHLVIFKIRDLILPRINILKKAGIGKGFYVVDYGCGPGSYIIPLAKIVGKEGMVYAVDICPSAIKMVKHIISKRHFTNVETICSDGETRLPAGKIDMVLLYDVFHTLEDPDKVLRNLHRILKKEGVLSFNDHRMKDDEIISKITGSGLFKLIRKDEGLYSFGKNM
ncbi:MAG: class I SAM-dependent methyltransferase [Candidatus Omnitrophica bacterium]|nr:class I SAM-dependent methyltransferase [Candidatus Omnitrophota bacterium]